MAKFIIARSEMGKCPTLEAEVSPFCEEIKHTSDKIIFVPHQGNLARIGLMLINHGIVYDLELDETTTS